MNSTPPPEPLDEPTLDDPISNEPTADDRTSGGSAIESPTSEEPKLSRLARLKATQRSLVERVDKTRGDLEERRKTNSFVDTALSTLESDTASGGAVLAGAVAFRVFLFQVPYVFVIVLLTGSIKSTSDEASDEIDRTVGIGTLTAHAIGSAAHLSGWTWVWSFLIGTFAVMLAARTAVKVIRVVHALVWDLPLVKFNATRAASGFIGVVSLAMIGAGLASRVRAETFVGGLLMIIVADGLFGLMFVVVELRLPRPPGSTWKDLVPGVLVFTAGVLGLHLVTVYWISYVLESKSEIYGAIGASLALLFWAYLLGRVLTTSIVVNYVRWTTRHAPLPPPIFPAPQIDG